MTQLSDLAPCMERWGGVERREGGERGREGEMEGTVRKMIRGITNKHRKHVLVVLTTSTYNIFNTQLPGRFKNNIFTPA